MAKKIIWSNIDLNPEDWREAYEEHLEINEIDGDPSNDQEVYDFMIRTNNLYLEDEMANLDKQLDGRLLVIADLGRWNGRCPGYRILDNNLNSLFIGGDIIEYYGDGKNIRATEHHHDGTNYYMFRKIREDRNINNLLDAIYTGEDISREKLNYYTKSIYKDVAEVYGW